MTREGGDQMGRIVVTEFISLDGVIEDPGGAEDYKHGGWSFEFNRGEDGDKFKFDELMEAEVQLFGRVTYERIAKAWPSRSDDAGFADRINSLPKYVVSSTLTTPDCSRAAVFNDDLADAVEKLKQ